MQLNINHRCHTNNELYIYNFDVADRRDMLAVIGRQALNPDLSLDWRDAYVLENRIGVLCMFCGLLDRSNSGCGKRW